MLPSVSKQVHRKSEIYAMRGEEVLTYYFSSSELRDLYVIMTELTKCLFPSVL